MVPPTIIQNRFRAAERSWDVDLRRWAATQTQGEVKYQGFWTLTGNPGVWDREGGFVAELAEGAGVSRAAAWYVLLMEAGVVVLNGTGDLEHMREDLEVGGRVRKWRETEEGREVWARCWGGFRELVGGC
jgi:hypothetical protein